MCSRPAVSTSTRSASRLAAELMASNTTDPGSAPSWPRTMPAPVTSAQWASCSAAAARNVSAAASTTRRPTSLSRCATLAIVVVFPTPFTPTNIQTLGSPSVDARWRILSPSSSSATSSACSNPMSASVSEVFSLRARSRTSPRMRSVVGTPTSARRSVSSRSSQVSSSMRRPRSLANAARVLPRRSRRRTSSSRCAASPLGSAAAAASASAARASATVAAVLGASSTSVPPTGRTAGGVVSPETWSLRCARRESPRPRATSTTASTKMRMNPSVASIAGSCAPVRPGSVGEGPRSYAAGPRASPPAWVQATGRSSLTRWLTTRLEPPGGIDTP